MMPEKTKLKTLKKEEKKFVYLYTSVSFASKDCVDVYLRKSPKN